VSTIVRFRTPEGEYAIPVEQVSEVRLASGLRPLPAPREGVVGLLPDGDESLSVLSVLGSEGEHVVVVDDGTLSFGLLVDEVLGIQHVDDANVQAAPPGQDRAVVAGVVGGDGTLVLLLDLKVLRGRLIG
jgi:chemotaxis signal transduction protein